MGIESNFVTMIVVHNSSEGSLLNNILQVYTIVLGYDITHWYKYCV